MNKSKCVAVVSGGVDSVTMAHILKRRGHELLILSFDYGQRHKRELEFAVKCANDLLSDYILIDISDYGRMLKGTSLTDNVPVPDGSYSTTNMESTVVPSRNLVFLSMACGIAAANEIEEVAIAVHAGDHPVYPDCRPEFIKSFSDTINLAIPENDIRIVTPFIECDKGEIVFAGNSIHVDYRNTWSCYKGGQVHCGVCATCVERKQAFISANVKDPTNYEN